MCVYFGRHCLFFGILLFMTSVHGVSSALTTPPSCHAARFGDCLRSYAAAKWVSYKYGLPFLYQPFEHSNLLVLHEKERRHGWGSASKCRVRLGSGSFSRFDPDAATLYILHYRAYQAINWEDEGFIALMRELIRPRKVIESIRLPDDAITIAVHVRRGGAKQDGPLFQDGAQCRKPIDILFKNKFPTHAFYVEQIKRLVSFFTGKKIYVHLFTDDPEPAKIIEIYKKEVDASMVEFAYRESNRDKPTDILRDFFDLQYFDCLIRGDSGFSFIAEKLGDPAISIFPTHVSFDGETLTTDMVAVRVDPTACILRDTSRSEGFLFGMKREVVTSTEQSGRFVTTNFSRR